MSAVPKPAEALRELAHRFRHAKNEVKDDPPAGREHRVHVDRVQDLRHEFENVLQHWVKDDALREAWRAHLQNQGPAPDAPEVEPPPSFKGRSGNGSILRIVPQPDNSCRLLVDGAVTKQILDRLELGADPLQSVRVGDSDFEEIADAPREALDRLVAYAEDPGAGAPWDWVWELYKEGLVDPTLALTDRGRRLLASRHGVSASGSVRL